MSPCEPAWWDRKPREPKAWDVPLPLEHSPTERPLVEPLEQPTEDT